MGSALSSPSPVTTADIVITFPEDNKGTVIYLIAANSATATDDGEVGPLLGLATRIDYDTRSPDVMISRAMGAPTPATASSETLTIRFFRKDASMMDGTADVPVTGFADADRTNIIYIENDNNPPATGGYLTLLRPVFAPPSGVATYTVQVVYPVRSQGMVIVGVKAHSATDASNSNKTGPPADRTLAQTHPCLLYTSPSPRD